MKIESNIDMPKEKSGRPMKYPWPDMKPGDSVFFQDQPSGTQSRPAIAAYVWARTNDAKFICRSIDGGVRIWRVE